MIEWLLALGAGAAVLKALSGKDKSTASAQTQTSSYLLDTRRATPSAAPTLDVRRAPSRADLARTAVAAWHETWDAVLARDSWIPKSVVETAIQEYPVSYLTLAGPSLPSIRRQFETHNADVLSAHKAELSDFFSTIESAPLTEEQMAACICMDDNVQIVAAAGSGKTSTMVAKAAYALKRGLVRPEEILLLAFNRAAADELKRRVQVRLADFDGVDQIKAQTFDGFGSSVIGQASGKKRRIHRSVDQDDGVSLITDIITDLEKTNVQFATAWKLFRLLYGRSFSAASRTTGRDQDQGFQTAGGETVKSKEEVFIADFLFFHNVSYEYERTYEHETATAAHSQYCPDFYYPDYATYHEHFALDEKGQPPEAFGQSYLDGVVWKRELHAENGTTLLETTSHQLRSAGANALTQMFENAGVALRLDETRMAVGEQPISNQELIGLIRSFQKHAKGNGLTRDKLRAAAEAQKGDAARASAFLEIYEPIVEEWDRRLAASDTIDFEDMMLLASGFIHHGAYQSPYRLILADEFQDSSRSRIRLLQELTQQAPGDTHLCVVGDDWQGINRFAGADISVMAQFAQLFPHATQLKLTKTFRCPQELCDASSAFVTANPAQIKKDVVSSNPLTSDGMRVMAFCYGHDAESAEHIQQQLDRMRDQIIDGRLEQPPGRKTTVLFLGRYNHDKPKSLAAWQSRYSDWLNIAFLTVHKSKGLEADYVIVLNLNEGIHGFPSQMEDDPLLQIPMPQADPFPYGEERRLFYVALTRARRQVRLYGQTGKLSRFVIELALTSGVTIRTTDNQPINPCPSCREGILRPAIGRRGAFEQCTRSSPCGFTRSLAPEDPRIPALKARAAARVPMKPGAPCPRPDCGGVMVVRPRGRPPFLGCSNFAVSHCPSQAQIEPDASADA